jgi:phosphatidylserine synthase
MLSMLMVSTIRYSSFKNLSRANYHPRMLILGIALIVMIVWFYSQWALLLIAVTYAAHGVVGKLLSMLRPRHSEPEPDLELESNPR